jgi:hypothetical protein
VERTAMGRWLSLSRNSFTLASGVAPPGTARGLPQG